jgi:hypothetical protein
MKSSLNVIVLIALVGTSFADKAKIWDTQESNHFGGLKAI